MNIKKEIDKYSEYFDRKLMESIEKTSRYIPINLYEPIEYILFTGGKRIRPFLLNNSYKIFTDREVDFALPFELALEMIHTYSLVHDDLPAMDNDDYRRGKPTVHKKYDEAVAILTGDGLLNMSFEIVSNQALGLEANDLKKYMLALKELSWASGSRGMIGGQVLDMEYENRQDVSAEDLLKMYKMKTSELFKVSSKLGAILAGASSKDTELIEEFGRCLGIAYQLQDDILDYDEDLNSSKVTLATIKGKEEAGDLVDYFSEKAKECLVNIQGKDTGRLEELVKLLIQRKY